ncbi:hypothetical protein ANO11243_007220 [Dothideomycetidae sp. 11243]|nr:hypothetical protein ANO11243_007220 [fungal sp. No.11243]
MVRKLKIESLLGILSTNADTAAEACCRVESCRRSTAADASGHKVVTDRQFEVHVPLSALRAPRLAPTSICPSAHLPQPSASVSHFRLLLSPTPPLPDLYLNQRVRRLLILQYCKHDFSTAFSRPSCYSITLRPHLSLQLRLQHAASFARRRLYRPANHAAFRPLSDPTASIKGETCALIPRLRPPHALLLSACLSRTLYDIVVRTHSVRHLLRA